MDEPTQNPSQQNDLQATVDAALGAAAPMPATPTTVPPQPPEPVPPVPAAAPMPEPVAATPLPPTKVQEDMPLAFAGQTTSKVDAIVPPAAVPPSVGVPPQPSPVDQPKKPRKMGKVVLTILGILSLFGAVGGGWYLYQHIQESREVARIAAIKNEADCSGCSKDVDGGWLVWRNGQCKVTGVCNSSKGDKQNTDDPEPEIPDEKAAPAECNKANGLNCCGSGYTYCGGDIKKCVSGAALAKAGGGCNKYGEVVYGIPTVYGSGFKEGQCSTQDLSQGGKQCSCGIGQAAKTLCFDSTGYCDQDDATGAGVKQETNFNQFGLCAVAGYFTDDGTYVYGLKKDKNGNIYSIRDWFDSYKCTDDGCSILSAGTAKCKVVRYTCDGLKSTESCTDGQEVLGSSGGFKNTCGKVQQLDVMCDGNYVTSRTRINPPCDMPGRPEPSPSPSKSPSPSPSASVSPTMACVGLSKNKPDDQIAVGTALTFTCNGTSTPAGAVALSYQFQVSKDGGAWQSLSATGATASYTVPGYGDYDVRCRACGEINNANVCDPNWQGASSI